MSTFQIIRTLDLIICPFSIFLSALLIYFVARYKRFRKVMSYLQVCLAVCDIVQSIVNFIGHDIAQSAPILCDFVGTAAQFFFNGITFWNFAIAVYCYLTIIYQPKVADSFWIWYHVYCWGLSLIFTIALFIVQAVENRGDVIGDAIYECWIGSNFATLRIYVFYIPLWLHFILIVGIYIRIIYQVYSIRSATMEHNISEANAIPTIPMIETGTKTLRKASRKYDPNISDSAVTDIDIPKSKSSRLPYKLIARACLVRFGFIVSWAPPSAMRLLALNPNFVTPTWLSILSGFSFASCGLWNSAAFFLTWFWPKGKKKGNK